MAEIPDNEVYKQVGSKFDVIKNSDMNTVIWQEKTCEFEV